MQHPHPRSSTQLTYALLLAAAVFAPDSVGAAVDYLVVPGSASNSIRLAVECSPDWRVAANLVSLPAWVSHANLTCTPGLSGADVQVTFDLDPTAPLGGRGALVVHLEARDRNGLARSGTTRRVPLRLAAIAPGVQNSFDIEQCCIPTAGIEGAGNGRPDRNLLLGAAPNPWHAFTAIRFGLPATTSVSLRVLDVAGRVVWKMRTPELAPGYHEVSWDGRDGSGQRVAPGLYLYELSAGAWLATGKTLRLR